MVNNPNNKKPYLSAVLIVKNEEEDLPKTLPSLKFVDEIVIVDDNSTDKTVEIANNFGAKVYSRTLDDYSSQRNFGAEKASGDWILAIDADEVVSKSLSQSIMTAVTQPNFDGYWIHREDVMFGRRLRYGEVGNFYLVRLYDKSKLHFERLVHEIATGSDKLGRLEGVLDHNSHPTIGELFSKINDNTDLDARNFFKQGVREPYIRLFTYPVAKFVINYILKRGFLDGFPGLILAVAMSTNSFLTRAKLRLFWDEELTNRK